MTDMTEIGLTYGQVIATLTLAAMIIASYIHVKIDIAKLQENAKNERKKLDTHICENENDFRNMIEENREEHKEILKELKEISNKIAKL